jgi:site-specific DNA recombinase
MNGIIYCRVSSKEQIEGTSLESQELACRECARQKGINVLRVFVGRGESAKFADRPELLELLDYCREHKGQIQALLVWKLDRLARNVSDHFSIKATLLKYGIQVISATEPIDPNPEGKLLETILAGFAQFDNDIRALRTVQGMRRKLQEGIFPWKPPLGYVSSTESGEKKCEPDRPDPIRFASIQKAWQQFAAGLYTKAEIQHLMTTWGVVTAQGRSLSAQFMDKLFRNKFYAGILVDPWTGEEHSGKHVPMITLEQFAQVQQNVLRRNRSRPHHRRRPEFPLRGTIRCPGCQRYMTSSFSRGRRGRRYPYYHCENRLCHSKRSHPASQAHQEFAERLAQLSLKSSLFDILEEVCVKQAGEKEAQHKQVTERLRSKAAQAGAQIRELIRMRAQGLLTDDEFMKEKAALEKQRQALEAVSPDRSVSVATIRERVRGLGAVLCQDLVAIWQRLEGRKQLRFQQCVFPVGFVSGGIGTAEIGLLFRAFQEISDGNSTGVAPTGESWNQLMQEIKALSALFDHSEDDQMAA